DTNFNGVIDPSEGRIVVAEGVDTSTFLDRETSMYSLPNATAVTPLTTLVTVGVQRGMTKSQVQSQLKSNLALPNVDLLNYDPLEAIAQNESSGLTVFVEQVKVQSVIDQTTSLLKGAIAADNQASIARSGQLANATSDREIAEFAIEAVADALLQDAQLAAARVDSPSFDLSNVQTVEAILQNAATKAGTSLEEDVSSGAAQIVAEGNQDLDDTVPTSVTNQELSDEIFFTNRSRSASDRQVLSLGRTSDDLQALGGGEITSEDAIANNTGASIDALIEKEALGGEPGRIPAIADTTSAAREALMVQNSLSGTPEANGLAGSLRNDEIDGRRGGDVLAGEAGDDALSGGEGADILRGGSGDDILEGNAGNDALLGNSGDDVLDGGAGVDTLEGGSGEDTLGGGADTDFLYGNASNDLISGDAGRDFLFGGSGDDILNGGAGNDALQGETGNDALQGGDGDDDLNGGRGTDSVTEVADADFELTNTQLNGRGTDALISIERANLTGGDGANTLDASAFSLGAIALSGRGGNDTLVGSRTQSSILDGGDGDDLLRGGDSDDILDGGTGIDTLVGGAGGDRFRGGTNDDDIRGGEGMDTVIAAGNTDFELNDTQLTGRGTDTLESIERGELSGGIGDNFLDASVFSGNVTLAGFSGADRLLAGSGDDRLDGGRGEDVLTGNEGSDTLVGGLNDDTLTGGGGVDTFVLTDGEGTDTIADFEVGTDVLALGGGLSFGAIAIISNTDGSARVEVTGSNEILAVLTGINASLVTVNDFVTV
ncbi:MAG: calcium-binding protein, partial [Cyanobacteria bacterium P01_D01_bin.123]